MLCQISVSLERRRGKGNGKETHQGVHAKQIFAHGCEFQGRHADFPAVVAARDSGAQRAPDDLVAEADAHDADP